MSDLYWQPLNQVRALMVSFTLLMCNRHPRTREFCFQMTGRKGVSSMAWLFLSEHPFQAKPNNWLIGCNGNKMPGMRQGF